MKQLKSLINRNLENLKNNFTVQSKNKTNNYVAVPVVTDKIKAYVSVDAGLSNVDQAIYDYIKLFTIPTSQSSAQIKIAVSLLDKNQLVKDEKPSSRNKEWYVDGSSIYFNGDSLSQLPYTGRVATEDMVPNKK